MEAVTAALGLSPSLNAASSAAIGPWDSWQSQGFRVTLLTIVTNASSQGHSREEGLLWVHGREGGQAREALLWSREFGTWLAVPPYQQVRKGECLRWEGGTI